MTNKEWEQLTKKGAKLWDKIRLKVDNDVWDMINEAVEIELQLEAECGQ